MRIGNLEAVSLIYDDLGTGPGRQDPPSLAPTSGPDCFACYCSFLYEMIIGNLVAVSLIYDDLCTGPGHQDPPSLDLTSGPDCLAYYCSFLVIRIRCPLPSQVAYNSLPIIARSYKR